MRLLRLVLYESSRLEISFELFHVYSTNKIQNVCNDKTLFMFAFFDCCDFPNNSTLFRREVNCSTLSVIHHTERPLSFRRVNVPKRTISISYFLFEKIVTFIVSTVSKRKIQLRNFSFRFHISVRFFVFLYYLIRRLSLS